MWEGYHERKSEKGRKGEGHEPLIPNSTHKPPPLKPAVKPSDRFIKVAERYLKWLGAPRVDVGVRNSMMLKVTESTKREVELIQVIRQLCPDMRVGKENSNIEWNEATDTVFLLLRLQGANTGSLGEILPTHQKFNAKATVAIKISKNDSNKFSDVVFIFEEVVFFRQIGLKLGDLDKIKQLGP